ncbi:Serine/arginine repetitive matrix protein 2 [Pelomyxa schiedti]|nr:Serine/arginine repetitive matrix protein 2 [Pelomyxa schiedti]
MSDALEANIAQLRRHFGNQLDRDALEAVLAVNDNDVSRAIAFLTATGTGVYVFNPAQENSLPSDYPGQTKQLGYKAPPVKLPPISDLKPLFLKDSTLLEHFNSQKTEYYIYTSTLLLLMHQCVEITRACRPKILASAWARRDYHLAEYLLTKEDYFQLPQVLAALNLLDAPRKVRQLRPKLAALEKLGTAKPAKIGLLRSRLHDLELEAPIGSLSGSLAKHVRKWVCSIPANKLMFYALVMPREPWQELADMIHLHPLRDFQPLQKPEVSLLPPPITTSPTASPTAVIPPTALVRSVGKQHGNFLNIAFGEAPPEASIFKVCENVNVHNIADVCSRFEVPYSFLRLHVKPIPDDVKPRIAEYTTLDQLIWYYEELANPEVDRVLLDRLRSGEEPQLGYGKLMERLLYFRTVSAPFTEYLLPIAERRLKEIQLVLEPPVVCAGDASYSMDVAIRCSTIIGSVLSCLTNAELKFFNDKVLDPPVIPRTISQVLDVTSSVRADGLTAPGCVIWNYLTNRRPIKFLIMVTDEIENVKFRDSFFPTLFMKYKREIAPDCTLVFVSFLENPAVKGRMVSALENMGTHFPPDLLFPTF